MKTAIGRADLKVDAQTLEVEHKLEYKKFQLKQRRRKYKVSKQLAKAKAYGATLNEAEIQLR